MLYGKDVQWQDLEGLYRIAYETDDNNLHADYEHVFKWVRGKSVDGSHAAFSSRAQVFYKWVKEGVQYTTAALHLTGDCSGKVRS